jgi:phosphoglycolate phosphatase-like HAD superfamily hydrolase
MNTLSLRTIVRNAAAVFSGCYGAVTRRAEQAGCSRQTVYDHARQVEQRLQPAESPTPLAEVPVPTPPLPLDGPTVRRLAVTAFAMGISTRQIEDLLQVILADSGPDHSTIARWIADAAKMAKPVLETLDAACVPQVQTLAIDEIFFGGDRPWSGSNRRA